jgi:hypothetical protein
LPAYFKINKERQLVISTFSGVFTLEDGFAHQEKLLKDPNFVPTFSQLIDCTQVTQIAMGIDDIRRLAQRSIFSNDARRSILVYGDVAYGFARTFMAIRESLGEKGIRVFHELDEALFWLLDHRTPSS